MFILYQLGVDNYVILSVEETLHGNRQRIVDQLRAWGVSDADIRHLIRGLMEEYLGELVDKAPTDRQDSDDTRLPAVATRSKVSST